MASQPLNRCPWVNVDNQLYVEYHDKEWGKPVHDDRLHFEMLCLEGAQAGLSWETILKKRARYCQVFANFDPRKVAKFSAKKIEALRQDPGIVRNQRKIISVVENAKAFLAIQQEFGSFDKYIWRFVDNMPIENKFKTLQDYPAKTVLSETISKDLKKRGFNFVGPTIIYAYMQAVGLVNDHTLDCFKRKQATWYVYIIETKQNTLYTGITTDVKTRFQQHCDQGKQCAKYLRGKAPLKLVFSKKVGSKSTALKVEYALKQLSLSQKKQVIHSKQIKHLLPKLA